MRRLGFRRWKRLHRLACAAALLGVVHLACRVKADLRRPAGFAVGVGLLLAARLVLAALRRARPGAAGGGA